MVCHHSLVQHPSCLYTYLICRDGFVRTAIRQGLLAPTPEQRKNYANALYVFTKIKTSVPQRLANLVDQYNVSVHFTYFG